MQTEMRMMMMKVRMKLVLQENMKRRMMKMMEAPIWGKVKRRRKLVFRT